MAGQNIAVKLCGVLQAKDGEVTAREWRLVGQEQDGSQILTWISTKNVNEVMNVGVYTHKSKTLEIVHTFEEKLNIIQASVNSSRSLLVYVVKVVTTEDCVEKEAMYCPFLISLLPDKVYTPEEVEEGSTKQIMLQFVYGKSNKYSPGIRNDRFLLFKHLEYIKIYRSPLFLNECDDGTEKWGFDGIYPEPETIVNIFSWAQWDCVNQVLFYIHYRPPTQSFAEGEDVKSPSELTPTLSALQFHADLPHETVSHLQDYGIPMSSPATRIDLTIMFYLQTTIILLVMGLIDAFMVEHSVCCMYLPGAHGTAAACGSYEDDPIPLRVHDCSHDLYIVCDQQGLLCLNIPLSLPHVPGAHGAAAACGSYEDDPIPLRVHDCSLDLYIVCDQRGLLCVCHHYLYKPLDDSTSSLVLDDVDLKDSGVNFAYSVTLLHHGCVVHSVVPDLPWSLAKSLRPSYTLYNDNHLLVNIPMLFTHIIDISPHHEPCCHIVIPMDPSDSGPSLAPLHGWGLHTMVDLNTLDVVTMGVSEKDLTSTFKSDTVIENKLAIMHYVIQHEGNMDLAEELISWLCLHQHDGLGGLQRVMQEYLIGTTYAVTRRSLPASAVALMNWLPFTLHLKFADVKAGSASVCVSVCALWRGAATAVVLAPRQRVSQFAEDAWTRLWAALCALAAPRNRLRPDHVRERLAVTLHCYQPEALSRCSTPMSPTGPPIPTRRPSLVAQDSLPFMELDVCTTSKQEHVIAANLRAVSVHLMTESSGSNAGALESGVHALATRWAAAQLDAARALCRAVVRAVGAVPQPHQTRGFPFIDDMDATHALVVFKALEQYYVATDSIAFPLPQGFSSFFTYLGRRALPFHAFALYVHRNVFELQIDVLKAIVASKDDDDKRAVDNKLRLIQIVGEARGRRALAAWPSRTALVLRARDHAAALLSGVTAPTRDHAPHRPVKDTGLAALPSGERLSPLDTFLDLLTAKASLNELDFNLIIEATLASVQQETNA